MSDVGLCLSVFKGPTACYLCYSRSRFGAFFWVSFFDVFLEANGHPQGPPKSLKILQNCVPEASLRALLKKSPKMIGKVIFPEGWICNPRTPVQSKHTFSFSLSSGPRLPKSIQKASQNGAFGHLNHKKTRKTNTQKNMKK